MAKDHEKKITHRMNTKLNNLQEDRKLTTAEVDFKTNDELRTHKAIIMNEITHLERTRAKTQKEILRA